MAVPPITPSLRTSWPAGPSTPDALSHHVQTRLLPLCDRTWWHSTHDAGRALKPPGKSMGALCRAEIARPRDLRHLRAAGPTFNHNGFLWRCPDQSTDLQLRRHYANVVREPGVRAGYIEIYALADALNVTISLWQVHRSRAPKGRGYGTLLGTFNDEAQATTAIAIGVIGETHFRALLPHHHKPPFHETEAGGMGECLFLATRTALQHRGVGLANFTASQLRQFTADRIDADATFDERVRAVTEQAAYEHALPNPWQKFVGEVRKRFVRRTRSARV